MERVKASLNIMDLLLWLSEEIETRDWNSNVVGTQLGLAFNFAFLIARANSGRKTAVDDVFSDEIESGWVVFLVSQKQTAEAGGGPSYLSTRLLIRGIGWHDRLVPRRLLSSERLLYHEPNPKIQIVRGRC